MHARIKKCIKFLMFFSQRGNNKAFNYGWSRVGDGAGELGFIYKYSRVEGFNPRIFDNFADFL